MREMLEKNGVTPPTLTYTIPSGSKKPRISRETTLESGPGSSTNTSSASPAAAMRDYAPVVSPLAARGNLNPRYTFDNFIVGSSNDLAYSASQAVAANPGVKYNPIYFYIAIFYIYPMSFKIR